ncbi:MAG TPA: ATP-binding cassette domain-containing protein [Thermoanaerobaculia bacterium]|nr:ATP-binding cassette domain-containing protein [Thermoanaerobaculia bacterium]
MTDPLLELRDIRKSFGGFEALRSASLALRPGRVTALVGENGAGKTTLMRIAAGLLAADGGEIAADKKRMRSWSVREAATFGVRMVEQHFTLASQLSLAENLVLHSLRVPALISKRSILDLATEMVARGGLPLDGLDRPVAEISIAEKAKMELIKATSSQPRVLIMDEPTSVLGPRELTEIEALLHKIKAEGRSVVIITHKLPEVFRLADDVAVMRAGEVIFQDEIKNVSLESIARMMSETTAVFRPFTHRQPEMVCAMKGVRTTAGVPLKSVNLQIGQGEIIGVVGAAGNGQSELAALLRGLLPFSGTVTLNGRNMTPETLFGSRRVRHIPADRIGEGLFGELSIMENLALGVESISRSSAYEQAVRVIAAFSIRARSAWQPVNTLSGGNQQKVLVARELLRRPELLVAAEPTRGLDLESASLIRKAVTDIAERGTGVLLIASDLEEVISCADRIHVLYRGVISEGFAPDQQQEIVQQIAGGR